MSFWQTILCAVLLAGATSTEDAPTPITTQVGETFTAYVLTLLDDVTNCYLVTSSRQTVQIIPEDQALDRNRFELKKPNSLVGCSVEVKQVDEKDNGLWELHTLSKEGVIRTHLYNIIVQANTEEAGQTPMEEGSTSTPSSAQTDAPSQGGSQVSHVMWNRGQGVDVTVGPSDSTFCQVFDPTGLLAHEDVQCRLVLDKVHSWHAGLWRLMVWTPGKIQAELWEVVATVTQPDNPEVTTSVEHTSDSVLLSCSVAVASETKECQFDEPSGNALRITEGATEGRYSYFARDSVSASVTACGLKITNPTSAEMGRWRCRIKTDRQTHFGFLPVSSSLAGNVDDIETTPQLHADRALVPVAAGERPVLSCTLHAAIRYCYFTAARNGSVYSVYPGANDYVGHGLSAGECGVRLPAARADDHTAWRCHVGVFNPARPEYTADINIEVTGGESMTVRQLWNGNSRSALQIEGEVPGAAFEYCRFVRMDGTGFTGTNAPEGYLVSTEVQAEGRCILMVATPSAMDLHPWTVVARLAGQDNEVSAVTANLINAANTAYSAHVVLWVMIVLISLSLFVLGMLMGPRKNREWTYRQAANIKSGVRNSIRKSPLVEERRELP